MSTIRHANIAYSLKHIPIPGNWLEHNKNGNDKHQLRPGVDFELPTTSLEREVIDWWKYFEEVEGGEVESDGAESDANEDCWYDAPS